MLQVLVGYIQDTGIDIRWLVMAGDGEFFSITKRIHNRLHGVAGDAGGLGPMRPTTSNGSPTRMLQACSTESERAMSYSCTTLRRWAWRGPGRAGARVVWRCHVGREGTNQWTDEAWSFLRPHLGACEAYVFSLRQYVPSWMDESRVRVIPPSIDPFSPKNQEMTPSDVIRTLRRVGLLVRSGADSPGKFTRSDGKPGRIERRASILPDGGSVLDPMPRWWSRSHGGTG